MSTNLPLNKLAILDALSNDLKFFCKNNLKIKTKEGSLEPFIFNKAQEYLHQRIEEQLAQTGMVRTLILKGRQQGCSTYVSSRYYQKAITLSYKSVYILSHETTSTETLFGIVDRYKENTPDPIRPRVDVENRRQLRFENGSEYRVGTAGAKSTGRSQTNQYFHGSEVAFYENTQDIKSGVLQTVADIPGTEIILESTANGVGNYFYKACMDALRKRDPRWQLVFIPWHWQPEYRSPVPKTHTFTSDELKIQDLYNLSDEQLYWRYLKINELQSESLFKQEYPFTVEEAFQTSADSLIMPLKVAEARKSTLTDPFKPIIIGCDPGRTGDKTAIVIRRGREVLKTESYPEMESMRLAGILARYIDAYKATKCFVDVGAVGYGTVDRLQELGYHKEVTGVHFGEKSIEPDRYMNKRAEMAVSLRDWFHGGPTSIPDDDESEEVADDLLCVPAFKQNSRDLIYIEPKDTIIKIYGKSPNYFDAFMLTFAYPVRDEAVTSRMPKRTVSSKRGSPLSTMVRARGNQKTKSVNHVDFEGEPRW